MSRRSSIPCSSTIYTADWIALDVCWKDFLCMSSSKPVTIVDKSVVLTSLTVDLTFCEITTSSFRQWKSMWWVLGSAGFSSLAIDATLTDQSSLQSSNAAFNAYIVTYLWLSFFAVSNCHLKKAYIAASYFIIGAAKSGASVPSGLFSLERQRLSNGTLWVQ